MDYNDDIKAKLHDLFETIISFFSSQEFEIRKQAIISLSKLRGQIASEIIFSKFQSSNIEDYLYYVLNKIDQARAAKELVNALNDSNIDIRIKAANILLSTKSEEVTNTLIKAIEVYLDKLSNNDVLLMSEEALIIAIKALGEIDSPYCIGLLRKLVVNDSNPKIRATAISSLYNHINESFLPLLQAMLKDPDVRVRANTIEAIQKINKPIIIGILQPYLYDSNQRIKANVVKAIWKFGDYDVTNVLKEMLISKDVNQISSALYAIGETKITSFYKSIYNYLNHENENVRKNAILALKKFKNQDSFNVLIERLNDKNKNNRIITINALFEINVNKAGEVLYNHLLEKELDPDIKAYIIKLLARHSKVKISQILSYLKDENEHVVCATIEALELLSGNNPSASAIIAVKNITNNALSVTQKIIEILWKWGITDSIDKLVNLLKSPNQAEILCGLKTAGSIFEYISTHNFMQLEIFENILFNVVEQFKTKLHQNSLKAISNQVNTYLNLALNSVNSNNLSEALMHYENVLKIDPYNVLALIGFAEIAIKLNNLDEAKSKLLKALEVDKTSVKAYFGLGKISLKTKNYQDAVNYLSKAIQMYPNLIQAYYLLSEAYTNLENYLQAYIYLRKVVEVSAPNQIILQKLAILAFINNNYELSKSIIKKLNLKIESEIGIRVLQAYLDFLESSNKNKSFYFFLKLINQLIHGKIKDYPIYIKSLLKSIELHFEKNFINP